MDSMLITAANEASENWDISVIDLPGAYLHAEMYDLVIMVMRGQPAELMIEFASETYFNYMTYHNEKAVFYVTIQIVLYGYLKSALLLYQKVVSDLKRVGY